MKRILLVGFLLFAATVVRAQTLYSQTRSLYPIFRDATNYYVNLDHSGVDALSVSFKSSIGTVTKEKWSFRFQGNEAQSGLWLFTLPPQLELLTCSVEFSFSREGTVTKTLAQAWGKCKNPPPRPDDRFLPDLLAIEETLDLAGMTLLNEGKSLIEKELTFLSYLENEKGEIIWMSEKKQIVSLSPEEEKAISFTGTVKNWHKKLGCRAHVVIDSEHAIYEKKKKNNDQVFSYGACEKTPVQGKDFYDFSPQIVLEDNGISLHVSNLGRLPLLNTVETVEVDIEFIDAHDSVIAFAKKGLEAPLHGFGDSKKVLEIQIPAGTEKIRAMVNRSSSIPESNYQNNLTQLEF